MYSKLHKITAVFLLLIFSISTSGIPVFMHECLKSNEKNVSFFIQKESCCNKKVTCCKHDKKENNQPDVKKDCCSEDQQFAKLTIETTTENGNPVFNPVALFVQTCFVGKLNYQNRFITNALRAPPQVKSNLHIAFSRFIC